MDALRSVQPNEVHGWQFQGRGELRAGRRRHRGFGVLVSLCVHSSPLRDVQMRPSPPRRKKAPSKYRQSEIIKGKRRSELIFSTVTPAEIEMSLVLLEGGRFDGGRDGVGVALWCSCSCRRSSRSRAKCIVSFDEIIMSFVHGPPYFPSVRRVRLDRDWTAMGGGGPRSSGCGAGENVSVMPHARC